MSGVADYIEASLALEQYAFSWDELKAATSKTDAALRSQLARLVSKREIINLRQGFYLILPPRYRSFGRLPVELYVEKLFNYLKKPYYIAFYSAAAIQGAGHQQIQQDYLLTQVPNVRDIKKGAIHLNIFATSTWPQKNILQRKSDAGFFNISSPVLTALDLVHYQSKLGGLNRMLAVIEELIEEINVQDVQDALTWYPHVSTWQRLGFMLEEIGADEAFVEPIKIYLKQQGYFPVLLSPQRNKKPGATGNVWKVDVNISLDSDLLGPFTA
jgi:hypothetical protein